MAAGRQAADLIKEALPGGGKAFQVGYDERFFDARGRMLVLGARLAPLGLQPERYRVEEFPSGEDLALLRPI